MHPERDVVDAAGTYTVFGLLISHEGVRMFVFFFFLLLLKKASLQMSELFNLGTEARTVVLRAHGTQTATEKTSYLFFMLFFL